MSGDPGSMGLCVACVTPLAMHLRFWVATYVWDIRIRDATVIDPAVASSRVLGESIFNGLVFGGMAHYSKLLATAMVPVLTTMGVGRMLAERLHGSLHWCLNHRALLNQDSWILKFVESIPGVGFLLALLYLVDGKKVSLWYLKNGYVLTC